MWACQGNKKTSLLALHSSGIAVIDTATTRFRVAATSASAGTLSVLYGTTWLALPFRTEKPIKVKGTKRTRRRIRITIGKIPYRCSSLGLGQESRLKGMRCSYKGRSTLNSSHSNSIRASFDGRGTFQYIRESYSSGGAGTYFNKSKAKFGMYRVEGSKIYVALADGGTGVAKIAGNRTRGTILTFSYGPYLLSSKLCK
ncbi:hypothetical protein KJ865_13620 [Myxococcota bacterium]|nr:hypothetical protein [Myxococcota bacterium]